MFWLAALAFLISSAQWLKNQLDAKERAERARWSSPVGSRAGAGTSGAGGGDGLDGASREDLGENLTPLERGLFDTLEAERRKDPEGRFAYLPAVNRDHYTVNERFHNDKECPGAGFVFAMMVRAICSCPWLSHALTLCFCCCAPPPLVACLHVGTAIGVHQGSWSYRSQGKGWFVMTVVDWFSITKLTTHRPCCPPPTTMQVSVDSTHGTNKEGLNLCNLLTSFNGRFGAPVACIYLGDGYAATLQRALQWVTEVLAKENIKFHPEVCFCDDDKAEHLAVLLTWPGCQVR